MEKILTRCCNEGDAKKFMEMDVTLLFCSIADKKAVNHTSNDLDFRVPEENVLTKLW